MVRKLRGSVYRSRFPEKTSRSATISAFVEPLESRQLLSAASTSTALIESIASSIFSQSVSLTATVTSPSGKPTGSVSFRDGSATVGTVLLNSSQKAILTIGSLPVGTDSLSAVYAGTSAFKTSTSSTIKQTVGKASTTTALTASASSGVWGQLIALTATVKPKSPGTAYPTGTVSFTTGKVSLGSATLSTKGVATLTTGALALGTDSILATFIGATDFASSASSAVSHVVTQASTKTAISLSTSSAALGAPITVTVTVTSASPGSGTPAGTVTLYDGKTSLGTQTLASNGKFSGLIPALFIGSHSLSASYAGTAQCKASASSAAALSIKYPAMTTAPDGLQTGTSVAGSGRGAIDGDSLHVNYTGYLVNGTVFDSSLKTGRTPFDFTLGAGQVIAGWDQGMLGMKVGEQRVLIIPPALGYGAAGSGAVPANATLIFVVQLLSFNEPELVITGAHSTAVTDAEAPTTANGTNFGSVTVGQSTPAADFTITNAGNAGLNFTANPAITLTGTNAGDFVLTQPVIANNAAVFTIVFKPSAKGTRSATITILTNDPKYPMFKFTIEGTGK